MRLPETPRRAFGEPVIPLINVVFLLLIFFMLAGTFTTPQPFRVDPPEARSGESEQDRDDLVLLGADGRLAFGGETLEDDDALVQAVEQRLRSDSDFRLRLKADGGVPSQRLLDVMDRLREAGAERLFLLIADRGD